MEKDEKKAEEKKVENARIQAAIKAQYVLITQNQQSIRQELAQAQAHTSRGQILMKFLSGLSTASISIAALGGGLPTSVVSSSPPPRRTIVAASPSRLPLTDQRKPCQAIPLFRLSGPAPLCFVYTFWLSD